MALFEIAHIAVYVLIVIGFLITVATVRKFEFGALNLLFISYAFGILFLGLSQLFDYLKESGAYTLSDISFHAWLHLIVYCALLSLIWGGYRVKRSIGAAKVLHFDSNDKAVFGILLAFTAVIFIAPPFVETSLSKALTGSFIDTFGLHHFIAMLGAYIAGWYLYHIRGNWGLLGTNILFMIGFLIVIGSQHGWEVITESTNLRLVSLPDVAIEGVEALLLVVATTLYVVGQWKIFTFVRSLKA